MITVWHPVGYVPDVVEQLRRGQMSSAPWTESRIPSLEVETEQAVCVITDRAMAGPDWPRLRVELSRSGRMFLVELTRLDSASVVAAMRDGAFDVLESGEARWEDALEAAAASQAMWLRLYSGRISDVGGRMVGRSGPMRQLQRDLMRLGPTDVTLLLLGESGVGKERFAAALHAAGRGGPMVALNCAALPKDLLEAELFGAEKGAFTGALRPRPGLVEQAAGGTLFLDEVGEMDLAVQPKLLRFLETHRARRIGGEREYQVTARIVSATNRDLETDVREGRFRADLYYRLAEITLRIPPLRERVEDIPELAQAFLDAANERFGKNVERLEPGLVLKLQAHGWPGNVRELKSVLDRLVLFHDGPMLREGWWDPPILPGPSAIRTGSTAFLGETAPPTGSSASLPTRAQRLAHARQLLERDDRSLSEVAASAGIHPTTLFRWRKAGKL